MKREKAKGDVIVRFMFWLLFPVVVSKHQGAKLSGAKAVEF
jgi:hypothetical protein